MGVVLEVRVFPLIAAAAPMTVVLIRPVGSDAAWENDMFQISKKFDRPLWLTVSSVCRQTMGTSGTYHGLVNS